MTTANTLLNLSEVPLFKSIPASDLAAIVKNYKHWDAPKGTLILEEGKTGDEFYVILMGRVEIVRALGSPEESLLGIRQPGEFIGEIGLLNQGAPRTATARVTDDARLLTITYQDFTNLLKTHPQLSFELASVLSSRITEALNETIRNLHDRNEKLQAAYNELQAAQKMIVEKEKLEHSLQVAREIQFSILPVDIPQMDGYDIGALMKPAQAVGGDFFGVYPLDENHMALIVGDVADKGMPAAIFMAQTHALLRASIQSGTNASTTLHHVNELLLEMNAQGLFATVIYGILNKQNGEFKYARAGHDLPLIIDAEGRVSEPARNRGLALGVTDMMVLEESTLTIPKGGFILLFSDGLPDGIDHENHHFERSGIIEVARSIGRDTSAQEICNQLFDALAMFQKNEPQFDDVTLMAVKRS